MFTRGGVVAAAVVAPVFLALFHHFFYTQHLYSWGSADWSHAYFVPLISLYILWQQRHEIARQVPRTCWAGLLAVLLSVVCYVFFMAGVPNHMGQGLSVLLCLFGVVLLLAGPDVTRVAFLPIAYLGLGVTISEKIMIIITFPLQLLATQGAFVLLNVIGVSTVAKGNLLEVIKSNGDVIPLNVAEACSGMRMVIAFIALGAAVALVGVRHWWQRMALLMLAMPVALVMNIFRVAVLAIASLQDRNLAAGEAHMWIGMALLAIAFVFYMGLVWVLNRVVVDDQTPASGPVKKAAPAGPPKVATPATAAPAVGVRGGGAGSWRPGAMGALATVVVVLGASAGALGLAVGALGLHLRKLPIQAAENRQVRSIPTQTPTWEQVGQDEVMSAEVLEELGTRNYLSRSYRERERADGKPRRRLELHLAYYTGMIDTVPHVPERCMTGAGWTLVSSPVRMPLNLDSSGWLALPDAPEGSQGQYFTARTHNEFSDAPGIRVVLPRNPGEIEMLVSAFELPGRDVRLYGGYFFIANGGHVGTAEGVRQLAFKLEDDYAYYLKVQVSSIEVADKDELVALSSSLIGELLPEISRCVPDWVKVKRGEYPADNPRRGSGAAK
ncbi:MAG: exosortase/archaeosortase family protein [Phycisphaerales bacterium]|jgi:exosortase|nr:exosortase [Phycisphaeraceae bacterium]